MHAHIQTNTYILHIYKHTKKEEEGRKREEREREEERRRKKKKHSIIKVRDTVQ